MTRMHQPKRRRLLGMLALLAAQPALAQFPGSAPAAVYLVPLDDFPEGLASRFATLLQEELGIEVKSSMRLPPLQVAPMPGSGQAPAEELLLRGTEASRHLPGLVPSTYRVLLTLRDINAQSGRFRFQFSMHHPELNASVVSMARLMDEAEPSERSAQRMYKLVKRAVGELHLGWRRSTDSRDLMYAPLMHVGDIDRIGTIHRPLDPSAPPPGLVESWLQSARDTVARYGQTAQVAGLLAMAGIMRAASARPETEQIGDWIYGRHGSLVRGIAAVGLPFLSFFLLYRGSTLLLEPWWVIALLAALFGSSAWLMADVHGSTLRFNASAAELRRLLRRPVLVRIDAGTVVEQHPRRRLFTVRDRSGNAIRFHAGYRPGAVPLVNYLLNRDAAPVSDGDNEAGSPARHGLQ